MARKEISLSLLILLLTMVSLGCAASSPRVEATQTPQPAATAAGRSALTPSPTATAVPVAPPSRVVPPIPTTPSGVGAQMVITGQVQEIDASARVITFVEPVHGLSTVALLPDTEVVAADGSPKDLRDIKPGMLIQVAGGAGGNGAVLARTIRILTGPTPLS